MPVCQYAQKWEAKSYYRNFQFKCVNARGNYINLLRNNDGIFFIWISRLLTCSGEKSVLEYILHYCSIYQCNIRCSLCVITSVYCISCSEGGVRTRKKLRYTLLHFQQVSSINCTNTIGGRPKLKYTKVHNHYWNYCRDDNQFKL